MHIHDQTLVPFLELVLNYRYTYIVECIIGNSHFLCVIL